MTENQIERGSESFESRKRSSGASHFQCSHSGSEQSIRTVCVRFGVSSSAAARTLPSVRRISRSKCRWIILGRPIAKVSAVELDLAVRVRGAGYDNYRDKPVKRLRVEVGLSQLQLAERSDLSRRIVINLEAGGRRANPPISLLCACRLRRKKLLVRATFGRGGGAARIRWRRDRGIRRESRIAPGSFLGSAIL